MLPLISIGIPTYNRPAQLEQAIRSCLEQTYENIEIIVFENGSNCLQTKEILEKYSFSHSNILYKILENPIDIHQNFRNILDASSGEYFIFLADDDFFSKNFIKLLFETIESNPNVVGAYSISRQIIANDDYRDMYVPSFLGGKVSRYKKYILNGDDMIFYALYRKSVLKETFYPIKWLGINRESYVNICYPMIFKILHYGEILIVPNESAIHYVECRPTNKKYYVDSSIGGKYYRYIEFFLRRANLYYYYLKYILNKDPHLFPYLSIICLYAFFKDNLIKLKVLKK